MNTIKKINIIEKIKRTETIDSLWLYIYSKILGVFAKIITFSITYHAYCSKGTTIPLNI